LIFARREVLEGKDSEVAQIREQFGAAYDQPR
jgi:hypothetical protein